MRPQMETPDFPLTELILIMRPGLSLQGAIDSQQGHERLRDDQHADQIHFKLVPEIFCARGGLTVLAWRSRHC